MNKRIKKKLDCRCNPLYRLYLLTSNKKKKEPKKKLESDLITIKKIKKSNKTNSTSSLSMHIKATNNEVFDEEDFQKSKYIKYYIN